MTLQEWTLRPSRSVATRPIKAGASQARRTPDPEVVATPKSKFTAQYLRLPARGRELHAAREVGHASPRGAVQLAIEMGIKRGVRGCPKVERACAVGSAALVVRKCPSREDRAQSTRAKVARLESRSCTPYDWSGPGNPSSSDGSVLSLEHGKDCCWPSTPHRIRQSAFVGIGQRWGCRSGLPSTVVRSPLP